MSGRRLGGRPTPCRATERERQLTRQNAEQASQSSGVALRWSRREAQEPTLADVLSWPAAVDREWQLPRGLGVGDLDGGQGVVLVSHRCASILSCGDPSVRTRHPAAGRRSSRGRVCFVRRESCRRRTAAWQRCCRRPPAGVLKVPGCKQSSEPATGAGPNGCCERYRRQDFQESDRVAPTTASVRLELVVPTHASPSTRSEATPRPDRSLRVPHRR